MSALWHRHKWEITGAQPLASYGDGWGSMTKLPTSFSTYVALRCTVCGDVMSKRLKGSFGLRDGKLVAAGPAS